MAFYFDADDRTCFQLYSLGSDSFHIYATGYRRAAECLAESLLKRHRFSDYEAFPVVFLYRHALELDLKHCICQAAKFASLRGIEGALPGLQKTHDLAKLATVAGGVLRMVWAKDGLLSDLLPELLRTCGELSDIDRTSMSFRYPSDNEGFPYERVTVALRTFSRHLSSVLELIDTVAFGLEGEVYIAEEARQTEFEALCLESLS